MVIHPCLSTDDIRFIGKYIQKRRAILAQKNVFIVN